MLNKPMRGTNATSQAELEALSYPRLYSHKYDGIRVMKQAGKAVTKSLKPLPNHFTRNWIESLMPDGIDGELIVGAPNDEEVYSRTFSGVMTKDGSPDFTLYVFDLCDRPDMRANERTKTIHDMLQDLPADVQAHVVVVKKHVVSSPAELQMRIDESLSLGYEGGMSQSTDGFYVHSKCSLSAKSQQIVKHKPEDDVEGEIVELHEAFKNNNEAFTNELGNTARATNAENLAPSGKLGSFTVRQLVDGQPTGELTKVSAGKMKHDEREAVWQRNIRDLTLYPGKIIKFRKMAYGQMANGAARHGRFIGWVDPTDLSLPD